MDNRANGRPMGPPKTLQALREWHWRLVLLNRSKQDGWHGHQFKTKADWHMAAVETLDKAIEVTAPPNHSADRPATHSS